MNQKQQPKTLATDTFEIIGEFVTHLLNNQELEKLHKERLTVNKVNNRKQIAAQFYNQFSTRLKFLKNLLWKLKFGSYICKYGKQKVYL